MQLWDAAFHHWTYSWPIKYGHTVLSVDFSPNGKTLAIANDDGTVRVFHRQGWAC